jgi:hypothetical protein
MAAGMVGQSNPLIKEKRKPILPIRFSNLARVLEDFPM